MRTLEEKQQILDRICPPSSASTYKNTFNRYKKDGLVVGTTVGAGWSAISMNPFIIAGGTFLGAATGYMYGYATGHKEGRKLQALGVKQADEACLALNEEILVKMGMPPRPSPIIGAKERLFW